MLSNDGDLSGWDWLAIRVLLIHSFRRIVLHDPLLPNALLPDPWIGDDAYRLAGEIYRICLPASEHYLCERLGASPDEAARVLEGRFRVEELPRQTSPRLCRSRKGAEIAKKTSW